MRALSTMTRMNLEKVVNDNNFHKRPFMFWDDEEIENLQNPSDVLPVLNRNPIGWENGNEIFFCPTNPSEFKAFKKWVVKQINLSQKETGFAITRRDGDFITVQAFTK